MVISPLAQDLFPHTFKLCSFPNLCSESSLIPKWLFPPPSCCHASLPLGSPGATADGQSRKAGVPGGGRGSPALHRRVVLYPYPPLPPVKLRHLMGALRGFHCSECSCYCATVFCVCAQGCGKSGAGWGGFNLSSGTCYTLQQEPGNHLDVISSKTGGFSLALALKHSIPHHPCLLLVSELWLCWSPGDGEMTELVERSNSCLHSLCCLFL